jgi:cell division protein FtsL
MTLSKSLLALAAALLWWAVLASAAAAVYTKYRARELFVELERLSSSRRDELDAEWGRLQLEASAWSTYAFVERVASERLHMSIPDSRDIEIVPP